MDATAEILKPKKKAKWKIVLLMVLSLIMLTIGSGFVYEWIASEQAKRNFPPPGKLVDVGGYRLHINKIGAGSPTILLEAGSGETSLSWRNIPKQLAEFATVVSYDRAGYAWSEKANTERTGANIVHEIHTALDKEGIGGPYIIVGHSLGGMYARLFAQTYRDEVAGLVLVDARPENDERDTKAIYSQEKFQGNPPASILKLLKMSGGFRLFKDFLLDGLVAKEDREQFINVIAKPSFFEAKEKEGNLAHTTEDAIRDQNLGSLPVKIIARGVMPDVSKAGISAEGGRKIEEIWQAGQRNMLNISTDSQLIVAKKSGHYVIHDEPDLVVNVIRSLFDKVSANSGGR
ncbi:alpha/beta fold hydrolase [Paenibacillus sp. DMB20]|uniref:alpha/beta fold hydrolase n=1 Tax=Paenibacillus sp. DMB20 TaxID=1642570 RepID=UPI00062761EB|nr:alpha/beta hydrolase [Paenibacillus sp. DMB20]KKO55100.1 alpha/beta hydrolase [Paenibacillus sp. DMB20]